MGNDISTRNSRTFNNVPTINLTNVNTMTTSKQYNLVVLSGLNPNITTKVITNKNAKSLPLYKCNSNNNTNVPYITFNGNFAASGCNEIIVERLPANAVITTQ